jgi:hypothetical protein
MTFGSLPLHCKSIPPQERRKIHPQILLCLRTSALISGILWLRLCCVVSFVVKDFGCGFAALRSPLFLATLEPALERSEGVKVLTLLFGWPYRAVLQKVFWLISVNQLNQCHQW